MRIICFNVYFFCCVACCGYEVGHEVTFLYLVCLFAFVMNHGCFSVHIVLRVGGCVVSIFLCMHALALCVLPSLAVDLAVFSHAACFVALSRAVKLVNGFLFFFLFYVSFLHKQ